MSNSGNRTLRREPNHPLVKEIIQHIHDCGFSLNQIADITGVSTVHHQTYSKNPRVGTLDMMLSATGYRIGIVPLEDS